MRILVASDTHGDAASLRRAILAQPQAQVVIHLGDGPGETIFSGQNVPAGPGKL